MRPLMALVLPVAAWAIAACQPAGPPPEPAALSAAEVRDRLGRGEIVLVDVRDPEAYADGHIPGALNRTWRSLKEQAPPFGKRQAVVTYCTCPDDYSAKGAARELRDRHGLAGAAVLVGGLDAWEEAGFPVERGAATGLDGARLYAAHCATCHQPDGAGLAGHFPPLAGNGLARMKDARPLILVALDGLEPAPAPHPPAPRKIPAFRGKLTDAELAAVLTHVRASWGNGAGAVSAEDVRKLARP